MQPQPKLKISELAHKWKPEFSDFPITDCLFDAFNQFLNTDHLAILKELYEFNCHDTYSTQVARTRWLDTLPFILNHFKGPLYSDFCKNYLHIGGGIFTAKSLSLKLLCAWRGVPKEKIQVFCYNLMLGSDEVIQTLPQFTLEVLATVESKKRKREDGVERK